MWTLREFDVLASTNRYAAENAVYLEDGTVVLARRQTEGRGRKDKLWISDEGGLYFTLLLKPKQTAHWPNLTQLLCLAVRETLVEAGLAARIKWPNDVLIHGKKITGVLAEAVAGSEGLAALALGAGINVGQREFSLLGGKATSLSLEGVARDGKTLLYDVLHRFYQDYEKVLVEGFQAIAPAYLHALDGLGLPARVDTGTEILQGLVGGISATGHLLLELENGTTREVWIGDIL